MGFPVPFGRWAARAVRGLHSLDDPGAPGRWPAGCSTPPLLERLVAEHEAGAGNHADRLWCLLNLEIWQRIFLDGEEPAELVSPD